MLVVVLGLVLVGAAVLSMWSARSSNTPTAHGHIAITDSDKKLALYRGMQRLWSDHVIWTREYLIGAIDETADVNEAARRLMKNQEDIGNAIVPYYGKEAGERLTTLLKEHISIAVELIKAAKSGDQGKFESANKQWSRNGADIVAFLSGANSNWPEKALAEGMNMHLRTTTEEAVARLNKDYVKDVAAFDAVFDHILGMSDVLAAGIIQQFPEKF
jgi:hypothetical protein